MTHPGGFDQIDIETKRRIPSLKWAQHPPDVLPLWVAEHDFRQPDSLLDELRTTIDRGDLGYSVRHNDVAPAYRSWSTDRYGWTPDPDLAYPCVDVLQGVVSAITALAEPGDGVILTHPVYHIFLRICPTSGRRQVDLPRLVDCGWQLDFDRLESLLAGDPGIRAILLSHPDNPTGAVADRATLTRLVKLAHEHDIYIVSDEIHGDIVYGDAVFVPLLSIPGAADRVVTVTSPAKTFALSGLRCALMQFGDEALRDRVRNAHPPLLLGHPARGGIDAAIAAWTHGASWVDGLVAHLEKNRDHLADRLGSEAPAARFTPPDSLFLAWIDVSACGLGPRPATHLLEHAKVALSEGADYGINGADHVRLNFGTSMSLLDEALDRLMPHLTRELVA